MVGITFDESGPDHELQDTSGLSCNVLIIDDKLTHYDIFIISTLLYEY